MSGMGKFLQEQVKRSADGLVKATITTKNHRARPLIVRGTTPEADVVFVAPSDQSRSITCILASDITMIGIESPHLPGIN